MKVNISIDDVSPHPESSVKVLQRCDELIVAYPDIKFTLFIPAAYWRTRSHTTSAPLFLHEHQEFCDTIHALSTKHFEIGYHGYYHGVPHVNNNDEFNKLDYKTANEKIIAMKREVEDVGLSFKNIIRPPAWRMSAAAIRAAHDNGIEIFALAPFDYAMATYAGAQNDKRVLYCDSAPPFFPLILKENTEIVYHACEWDKNYLDIDKTNILKAFLRQDDIQFCFMGEMT